LEGFMLVRRDRRLIGTLVVTVIYNTFGWPFTSMIPVIGQDNLGLGAAGIGILASMDGVGAFCGAVAIALLAKPRIFARLYIYGVLSVCIGVGMIGFIHLGLLAGLVGASWATVIIGAEGIAAMALTRRWWRAIAG